jgi:thioredoxin-like negative regulator of GroEL
MNLDNYSDPVQRYVVGKMTTEEQTAFETVLQNNPKLAAEVRDWQLLRVVSKHRSFFESQIMLDKIMAENPIEWDYPDAPPPTNAPPNRFKGWLLKSVIWILLGTAAYGFYQYKAGKNYYKSLITNILENHSPANILGFDTTSTTPLIKAMRLYDVRQYDAVIPILNQLAFKNQDDAQFYLAIAYLHTGKAALATPILRQLANKPSIMKAEAQQYLPVALVAENKMEEAKQFLQTLPLPEKQKQPAKLLLEKLE